MSKTPLQVTYQSVRVPVTKKGYVVGDFTRPLFIKDFFDPLREFFYNKMKKQWELQRRFYWFNPDYNIVYFPRFMLDEILIEIKSRGGEVDIDYYIPPDGKPVEAPMPGFKPKTEIQAKAIEFVTNEKIGPVRVITLDPGLGKTVISFRYTNLTKRRVLIHSSMNMKDWPRRVKDFVDIPDEKIYYMSGQSSMDTLIAHIDEIDPVYILTPTQTLRNYCRLRTAELGGRPEPEGLLQHLGVHTRINDEAHKHLETNIMLDMRLSSPVVVPLTATLEASGDTSNRVLDLHYPKSIRFAGSVPNHVHIYDIVFTLNMEVKKFHYTQRGMYSHIGLEGWLLKGGCHFLDKIIKRVYIPLLEQHYVQVRKPGQKCFVLTVTTDYAETIKNYLSEEFPNLNVVTYFSSCDDEPDPKADIIVTTLKSGGTGTDVKNLITVLNTVAVKSSPENKQNVGRLRTIDGVNPRYIFVTWKDVPPQSEYRQDRLEIYKEKAKELFRETIVAR